VGECLPLLVHQIITAVLAIDERHAPVSEIGGGVFASFMGTQTTPKPGGTARIGGLERVMHHRMRWSKAGWFRLPSGQRLRVLHELMPGIAVVAVLRNPNNANAETHVQGLQATARTMGIQLRFVSAATETQPSWRSPKCASVRWSLPPIRSLTAVANKSSPKQLGWQYPQFFISANLRSTTVWWAMNERHRYVCQAAREDFAHP
jgi:hypothetical protein